MVIELCSFPFGRSLPYKITSEDMYDIFGKYGAIQQIRLGTINATRGTAYVVYEDIFEAKHACENLNGFQVAGRYLIVSRVSSIFVYVSTMLVTPVLNAFPLMLTFTTVPILALNTFISR